MAASVQREKQRERERRARQRRVANLEQMRFSRHTLQNAVLAVRTLDEDSWERFLNPDAMRVRHYLLATKQAESLKREQAALQRLLAAHQFAKGAVSQILTEHSRDDWEESIQRSHKLVEKHYLVRTLQECQLEMRTSLREFAAFQWSTETETSGVQFLGWRERRRVDYLRHLFQFQFCKTFRGHDVTESMNIVWDSFTDTATFKSIIIGHRLLGTVEILQQLGPNAMIVRIMERFPTTEGDVHVVYLVFRVRTEHGYLQCARSLYCPELMEAFDEPRDVWPSNFIWIEWELLDDEKSGYKLRIGGSMVGQDTNYLRHWMIEMFGCVVRAEHLATKRTLLASS